MPLNRTGCERMMILEKLWEKANVKFFWIEGMQIWSKGKLVGLVLPILMAHFTWTPCSEQQNSANEENHIPMLHVGSDSCKNFNALLNVTAEIILKPSQSQRALCTNHLWALTKNSNTRKKNYTCNMTQVSRSRTDTAIKCDIPCLLEFWSSEEAALDRLSIELGCVHWGRRDWDWEVSFTDKPPVMSMLFTFMFGFSPAKGK